ncbi:N-acetylglutamate synthase-like GNAT family acetyltransferase [Micromonospora violae]|uniref:N-acetylglutamate synthase-like GNAT family acetyltransferase n=1 Tax=Micromonospora violae TaxID=1278207 RepID=A0A4Q7UBW5_9ACTN|nr:N-acetylglutamate synthase-like GNAT family acetyltransferase [Micromonospora violae]
MSTHTSDSRVTVRKAVADDAPFIDEALADAFGSTMMAVHDELVDATGDAAAVAERHGNRVGVITYRHDGTQTWEILSLAATEPGTGAGSALLDWLRAEAIRQRVTRLWLVTTNENLAALRFYQRRGFDLLRVERDAVTRARRLKPSIPLEDDGIPIRHELVLELRL